MGIEGGSIGSVNVGPSIGPSIRGISSGIEGEFGARGGPSLGGIRGGIADLEATVPLGRIGFSIVNEGPVAPEALNNMDIVAKPISPKILGEIVFKPSQPLVIQQAVVPSGTRQAMDVAAAAWEVPSLNAADAISEARSIIAQAQKPTLPVLEQPKVAIVPNIIPARMPGHLAQPELVVAPHVVSRAEPMVLPWVEPAPALQVSPSPLPQPLLQEQEVEEIVTEKITKEDTGLVEKEEIEKIKRKYVVDERALSQVVVEFKAAVRKARELAGKLGIKITGKLISKFLQGQHPGNESEAVKGKGPDGSIPERQQSVEGLGELSSDTQTEDKVVKVAYEKPPIKIRSEGEPVRDVDVTRVFKYHVVRPTVTHEIVIKRVVKKKAQVIPGQAAQTQTEARVETSLEDYPDLAEVFKP